MKELMRKGFSLLLFDCYSVDIAGQLKNKPENFALPFNGNSTRWILISGYWFKKVPLHFAVIVLIGFLSLLAFSPTNIPAPIALAIAIAAIFPLLICSFYLPLFTGMFLPELYSIQQIEFQQQFSDLEKCRKAQLPNPTLVLIWYVLDKTSGIDSLKNSDDYSGLLNQLYGIDQRSIKTSMEMFLGNGLKRNRLKGRARTEMENRFSEAYQFFEALKFEKAISILKELETRCFSKAD